MRRLFVLVGLEAEVDKGLALRRSSEYNSKPLARV